MRDVSWKERKRYKNETESFMCETFHDGSMGNTEHIGHIHEHIKNVIKRSQIDNQENFTQN